MTTRGRSATSGLFFLRVPELAVQRPGRSKRPGRFEVSTFFFHSFKFVVPCVTNRAIFGRLDGRRTALVPSPRPVFKNKRWRGEGVG